MNITRAHVIMHNGQPLLDLTIDGRSAQVVAPKLALLSAGIVVLLDEEGYWPENISAFYKDDQGRSVRIRGGATDSKLVQLVHRFSQGATGDLLHQDPKSKAGK